MKNIFFSFFLRNQQSKKGTFTDGLPTVFGKNCTHAKHPALLGYTRMWGQFPLCSFLENFKIKSL